MGFGSFSVFQRWVPAMDAFQVLMLLIGLANVGLLSILLWKLGAFEQRFSGQISRLLRTIEQKVSGSMRPLLGHSIHGFSSKFTSEFFVCWRWVDGAWQHQPSTLPKGAQAGLPPAYPGAFHGQVVKTWVGTKV